MQGFSACENPGMDKHTVELTERELRALLHAMDMARDQTANAGWRWWHETRYADSLYRRLLELPPLHRRAA